MIKVPLVLNEGRLSSTRQRVSKVITALSPLSCPTINVPSAYDSAQSQRVAGYRPCPAAVSVNSA